MSRAVVQTMYKMQISFRMLAALASLLFVVGCASPLHQAPVEDRGRVGTGLNPTRLPPGAENAGKPGYYTVKPGDTLLRIALEAGQNWRDLVAWNGLENPNLIEVGQVLRVVTVPGDPPPAPVVLSQPAPTPAVAAKPVASPKVETRPLDAKSAAAVPPGSSAPVKPGASAPVVPVAPVPAPAPVAENKESDEPAWQWPTNGAVVGNFEEGKRKGVVIGGKAGDPVYAAADGRVVYAGSSLRGYGNLVIVKHNAQYLTAYAHNQTLLVKEDQVVRKGQKIAEMGSTDAERVQLHFEIRKQGKPIDPVKSLPTR
jgi:lipoprotein NlpD